MNYTPYKSNDPNKKSYLDVYLESVDKCIVIRLPKVESDPFYWVEEKIYNKEEYKNLANNIKEEIIKHIKERNYDVDSKELK